MGTTKAVILLHTLPDGSTHFDWFIEMPTRFDDHRLLSFRSGVRPDHSNPDIVFHVEHLPNHRVHYLTHEGDIGADRGEVIRVSQGECTRFLMSPESDQLELVIEWDGAGQSVYRGTQKTGNSWAFRSLA